MAVDRHWSGYAWILTGFVDGVRRPLHKNNHRLIWNTAEEVREKFITPDYQRDYPQVKAWAAYSKVHDGAVERWMSPETANWVVLPDPSHQDLTPESEAIYEARDRNLPKSANAGSW